LSTGKPVYGGISFVDLSLDAKVVLQQYRTVGGQWTLNTQEMLETIANIVFNPRKLTWDQISGKPKPLGLLTIPLTLTICSPRNRLVISSEIFVMLS